MRTNLLTTCERFIGNRDAVKSVFRFESDLIYPVCANIYCAAGVIADAARLEECKALLKRETGVFSSFRGTLSAPAASMLAVDADPEARMARVKACYEMLKRRFKGSDYLALAALLLTGMEPDDAGAERRADRAREIFLRMKEEHPFLTGREDSVFAVLTAFSEQDDDALTEGMEAAYRVLRERYSGNASQSVSHVLSMAAGDALDKVNRMNGLYDALADAGRKYGKDYELATLAALSLADAGIDALARDILDVDLWLAEQKGYRGAFGIGKRHRLMQAAMIVSDEYAPGRAMDGAAVSGVIGIIAAQQAALCAVMASTAAASASSSR